MSSYCFRKLIQSPTLIRGGEITNFTPVVAFAHHKWYGIILPTLKTQFHPTMWNIYIYISDKNNVFVISVEGNTIINVYKTPNIPLLSLPVFLASMYIYAGDFNSYSQSWEYDSEHENGRKGNDLTLLFNVKDPDTFHSARWNRLYTSILFSFKATQCYNIKRHIELRFSNSQHVPVLITTGMEIPMVK